MMIQREYSDPWPGIDEYDPRRHITDQGIFNTYVELSDSKLTLSEKAHV